MISIKYPKERERELYDNAEMDSKDGDETKNEKLRKGEGKGIFFVKKIFIPEHIND